MIVRTTSSFVFPWNWAASRPGFCRNFKIVKTRTPSTSTKTATAIQNVMSHSLSASVAVSLDWLFRKSWGALDSHADREKGQEAQDREQFVSYRLWELSWNTRKYI